MYRMALAIVLASLVLSGCGSSSGSAQKPKASATNTYITSADTDAINKPANVVLAAASRAASARNFKACYGTRTIPAWRRCWHGLLDPYAKAMVALAGTFKSLGTHDFPDACVAQLEAAERTFRGFAAKLDAQLTGFDSDVRSKQSRAVSSYAATVNSITNGFKKPFQDVTQVCYSPQDLASINANPSPSAEPTKP